jgi:hypothetical protein
MAMKKTYGGDSPLRQGAEKSFWTLPISGRQRWQIAMCFWKIDQVSRFFPSRGLYRRRGSVRSGPRRPHHQGARARGWPCRPMVWLARGPPPSPLRSSRSFGKNRRFGFCFVQFQEYFLCNFSKTSKNRELALWHLVNRLVPENA